MADSGWTLDTLNQHLSQKIADVEKRVSDQFIAADKVVSAAMAAADKAVAKAETAAEKRFDSVNEFRSAMKDQQNTFADKAQTDFRLASIEARLDKSAGRSQGVSMATYVIVQVVLTVAAVVSVGGMLVAWKH